MSIAIGILALLAPAGQAQAAWQLAQIEQGDGQGGSIAYPAYKQEVSVPNSSRTLPFGLAQMDNGQVAMVVGSYAGGLWYPKITFSSDERQHVVKLPEPPY